MLIPQLTVGIQDIFFEGELASGEEPSQEAMPDIHVPMDIHSKEHHLESVVRMVHGTEQGQLVKVRLVPANSKSTV